MGKQNEKEKYREMIVERVNQINNEKYLRMIFGYVNSAYKEEKNGG